MGFLFCGEQPLNILEVVGLRAPTAVAECHRHSAKSRPSLRMERALRSGRWDSICCGKQPLNILEVVGLRAPTAVETCHWHVSKSRLSLRMEQALRSGRWDSFSAEKPRRLQSATGTLLRAAFRIPPSEQKNNSHPNGWLLFWQRLIIVIRFHRVSPKMKPYNSISELLWKEYPSMYAPNRCRNLQPKTVPYPVSLPSTQARRVSSFHGYLTAALGLCVLKIFFQPAARLF